jgi:signal transduction histidine kinase
VAHEVNTPLAVISTYAQMLAKQIAGDVQKAPLLEKIARQTFRASEIVNSLLNFSRTSPTEFVSRGPEQGLARDFDPARPSTDQGAHRCEASPGG